MARFTYRDGSYYRDEKPFFFIGVDYQYYRDERKNWAARLDQIKEGHGNVITFYTPWRHHIVHDQRTGAISYDFTGETLDSRDLVHFMELCAQRGLYMVAKPGPFVHSELNIGGLPDIASPSFNRGIEPVRMHDGRPLYWEYDYTQLPSPADATFDELATTWLKEVRRVLAVHAGDEGYLIGIQLNDETIYCSSNDGPWIFGYDAPDIRRFYRMLKDKYGDVENYNRLHGTSLRSLETAAPPRLNPDQPAARKPEDLLSYMDWGEFQWRLRTDYYDHYKKILDLDLPYLTNFAGITPPIDENVPDAHEEPAKETPPQYIRLYPEWWFAHNRVDQDAEIYHYGMISWLGVAAYNIADAASEPGDLGTNDVFFRYINTARRRRGINMEENWGFSKLYHPLSKYPIIPFFQTLASVAGGCTGYVIFTGVCHAYWIDDLDRTTKKQHPTFPADAPIGSNGETGGMYEAMKLLGEYFAKEGQAFLAAKLPLDVCYLIVPDYASVSSWVPAEKDWELSYPVPRVGTDALEPAARIFNTQGVNYAMAELPALTDQQLAKYPVVCLQLGFFLAAELQLKLVRYLDGGGRLIACGPLPTLDERMAPCMILQQFIKDNPDRVLYSEENIFAEQKALIERLKQTGWTQQVSYSEKLYAFVYRNREDFFVFFFNFGDREDEAGWIEFYGQRLELTLGPKASGVIRVRSGRLSSFLVKADNEYENISPQTIITYGDQEIRFTGDRAQFDLDG